MNQRIERLKRNKAFMALGVTVNIIWFTITMVILF